jgi:hypothetical protein
MAKVPIAVIAGCLCFSSPALGGFLYAQNSLLPGGCGLGGGPGNLIYGFAVDELSGTLSSLAGFPVETGGSGGV